jgi:Tfp pilus assembly major pilin PilA
MGKHKNNQKGFSVLEAILIVVVVVLIGAVGYLVYKNHDRTTTVVIVTKTVSKPAKSNSTKNKYAGWLQYCSSHEKACFKYPSTWLLQNNCAASSTSCRGINNVTITSPAGTIISFASEVSGVSGACLSGTPDFIYNSVETIPNVSNLYLVVASRADINAVFVGLVGAANGLAPTTGDTGTCTTDMTFKAKSSPGASAWFYGQVPNSAKSVDLTTSEQILQSYSYE